MLDKILGAVIICVCLGGMTFLCVDATRRWNAMLRDERLARIAANERCYKVQTWMCYMDEKIRREQAEEQITELTKKLKRAEDTLAKSKVKH